jgi:sodium-dependent dicarboxylate transporter 2/3/5
LPHPRSQDSRHQQIGLYAGPAIFLLILVLPQPEGLSIGGQRMAAIGALMAAWWITEAVHIAVTALLPIALFPIMGIMSSAEVAPNYANHIIFLFMGGFIIALAMEKWNLHRRIALETIRRVGTDPHRLILGFMVATALLSMWISNTATTMMMLPIATAVVIQLSELAAIDGVRDEDTPERVKHTFGLVLLLGIAYAASVGGIGTIIGSATTVAFLGFAQERFPDQPPITFLDWSLMCVPIVIVFIPICWLYLCRFGAEIPISRIKFSGGQDVLDEELKKLGPMLPPERKVLIVSCITALLWVFRLPLEVGDITLPGWSGLFPNPGDLHDATVAMAMAVLLCLLPVNTKGGMEWQGSWQKRVMDWQTAARGMPWGIIFLLGGGFALAGGIEGTGLAKWLGEQLSILKGVPIWVLVPLSCLFAVTMTETTSNVATVLMISPVIAATAVEIGVPPYLLLIPSAIIASFAFMLPVATPPNAIVFSSGWVTIPKMFRAGVMLDVIALFIVPGMVYVLGSWILNFGD